jgi:hypothetical protein
MSRGAFSRLAMGFFLAGFGVSAVAQTSDNQETTWGAKATPSEVQALYSFSRCAVRHDPVAAARLLDGSIDMGSGDRNLENFAEQSTCTQSFSFDNGLLAGGIAENLLKQHGKIAGLATELAASANAARIYAHSDMEVAGICLANKAPADVASLLSSTPGGTAENAALDRIIPSIGNCVPHGQVARFSRPGLRALLAVAAYRIVTPAAGN